MAASGSVDAQRRWESVRFVALSDNGAPSLSVLHLDPDEAEAQAAGLVARVAQTVDAGAPEHLHTGQIHVPHAYAGPDAPDVAALDAGELHRPAEGQRATAQNGQDHVTAVLHPAVRLEGHPPDAINTVRPFRLSEGIFKEDLLDEHKENCDESDSFPEGVRPIIFQFLVDSPTINQLRGLTGLTMRRKMTQSAPGGSGKSRGGSLPG